MEKDKVKLHEVKNVMVPDSGPDPCCGNCPYWFLREDLSRNGIAIGDCRLKPAQLFLIPTNDPLRGPSIGMQTHYPPHQTNAWCGEHPARKAEVAAAFMLDALDMVRSQMPGIAVFLDQTIKG